MCILPIFFVKKKKCDVRYSVSKSSHKKNHKSRIFAPSKTNKMDISGRLIQVLQEQGGEGKTGNKWAKCDFVIETQEKFPKKVCITAWNDLIGTVKGLPIDSEVKVSFDISSREYNGKWYTDVKAWKVESSSASSQSNNSNSSASNSNQGRNSNSNYGGGSNTTSYSSEGSQERHVTEDDLPF
jgi:hypothetical protein